MSPLDMEELFYKIVIRTLLYAGLGKPMTQNKALRILYTLYTASALLFFFVFTISQYIYLVNYEGNILEMLKTLSVSLLYSVTIIKIKIVTGDQYMKFRNQIRITEHTILENNDDGQKEIYMNTVSYNHTLNKLCIACVIAVTIFSIMKPFTLIAFMGVPGNSTLLAELDLPFAAWTPFDTHKYYIVAFCFQSVGGTCGSMFIISSNLTFWSLLVFAIGNLRILQYRLRSLNNIWEQTKGASEEIRQYRVFLMFKKCAVMHQIIIQYIQELDQSLTLVILIDFVLLSLLLGITGFLAIGNGFGLPQFFDIQFLVGLFAHLVMFYWHGNEIIVESLGVSDAAYESGFYNYNKSLQKDLMFLMLRAHNPLKLTVGPLYIMSTATAVTIVRGAYSYIAVMRELYN